MKLAILIATSLIALLAAAHTVRAQEPTTTAGPSATATGGAPSTGTPTAGTQPVSTSTTLPGASVTAGPEPIRIKATVTVEPGIIPAGTLIRVRTAAGVCLEFPLPEELTDIAVEGGTFELPEFSIPSSVAVPGCGVVGEITSVELVFPDGSASPLISGPLTPGLNTINVVVRASAATPTAVAAQPVRLPGTGNGGHGSASSALWVVCIVAGLGMTACAYARIIVRRAR